MSISMPSLMAWSSTVRSLAAAVFITLFSYGLIGAQCVQQLQAQPDTRKARMAGVGEHVSRVRALYKAILKLHRGLPLQMQALGDQYVKEEFRLHKEANKPEVDIFMTEWTRYYVTLAKQLGPKRKFKTVGENLSPALLDNFNDEQIGQLKELLDAATNPAENQASGTKEKS